MKIKWRVKYFLIQLFIIHLDLKSKNFQKKTFFLFTNSAFLKKHSTNYVEIINIYFVE